MTEEEHVRMLEQALLTTSLLLAEARALLDGGPNLPDPQHIRHWRRDVDAVFEDEEYRIIKGSIPQ